MFSKSKGNILFALIVSAIIAMTVKAFTLKLKNYDDAIDNLNKQIESCKATVDEISQIESDNSAIRKLEKRLKNHMHDIKNKTVIFE